MIHPTELVYSFIFLHIENHGYPPTHLEIADVLGDVSPLVVDHLLRQLAKQHRLANNKGNYLLGKPSPEPRATICAAIWLCQSKAWAVPTRRQLARLIGRSISTTTHHLNVLIKDGIITRSAYRHRLLTINAPMKLPVLISIVGELR